MYSLTSLRINPDVYSSWSTFTCLSAAALAFLNPAKIEWADYSLKPISMQCFFNERYFSVDLSKKFKFTINIKNFRKISKIQNSTLKIGLKPKVPVCTEPISKLCFFINESNFSVDLHKNKKFTVNIQNSRKSAKFQFLL